MAGLTAEGRSKAAEVAARHGVSAATAETLLIALAASGGGQAQFSIPELGGMGQWSRGGMVMVGDMFNNGLKARVDALCNELSGLVGSAGLVTAGGLGGNWWPADLGSPASAGSQNDMAYAFFPAARRLAIKRGGVVTVYDSGDHSFGGFSQQQGSGQSLSFSSQLGTAWLGDLKVVGGDAAAAPATVAPPSAAAGPEEAAPVRSVPDADRSTPAPPSAAPMAGTDDIFGTLERLADLRAKGILTDEEFAAKKAELLGRL